jgi:hypothetical protein
LNRKVSSFPPAQTVKGTTTDIRLSGNLLGLLAPVFFLDQTIEGREQKRAGHTASMASSLWCRRLGLKGLWRRRLGCGLMLVVLLR